MFGSGLFSKVMLRDTCSCGEKGIKFDGHYFECPNQTCGVWDGKDEWEQLKVLVKEQHTVIDRI